MENRRKILKVTALLRSCKKTALRNTLGFMIVKTFIQVLLTTLNLLSPPSPRYLQCFSWNSSWAWTELNMSDDDLLILRKIKHQSRSLRPRLSWGKLPVAELITPKLLNSYIILLHQLFPALEGEWLHILTYLSTSALQGSFNNPAQAA